MNMDDRAWGSERGKDVRSGRRRRPGERLLARAAPTARSREPIGTPGERWRHEARVGRRPEVAVGASSLLHVEREDPPSAFVAIDERDDALSGGELCAESGGEVARVVAATEL